MNAASVGELMVELDFPELESITTDELATNFMPASVAGLADGDMAVIHPLYADPQKIRLYGKSLYNHGEVAQRIQDAAVKNGNQPSPIYAFQNFVANYCHVPGSPFYNNELTEHNIKIHPEVLEIDDNIIALREKPDYVVDYTACLSSRSLLRDQLRFAGADEHPFALIAITRMHFTNIMLMNTYDRAVGPGTANLMIDSRRYIGREDGIGSATDEIITSQRDAGAIIDFADVILCNGGQHSTKQDLRRGAENAFTIAREEGLFVIRAFAKPSADEIGTDEIAAWAFEAGFKEQAALEYEGNSHSPGAAAVRPQETTRAMKTLVLTK